MSANIVALSLMFFLTISEPYEEVAESFWQELATLLKGNNTPGNATQTIEGILRTLKILRNIFLHILTIEKGLSCV
jgi:hypothetical protein